MKKKTEDKRESMMLWGITEKKELSVAIDEALKYFRKKYKEYLFEITEIHVSHNILEYPKEFDGLEVRKDKSLFSTQTIAIVFDEKNLKTKKDKHGK